MIVKDLLAGAGLLLAPIVFTFAVNWLDSPFIFRALGLFIVAGNLAIAAIIIGSGLCVVVSLLLLLESHR
jgi:hypothetical protein